MCIRDSADNIGKYTASVSNLASALEFIGMSGAHALSISVEDGDGDEYNNPTSISWLKPVIVGYKEAVKGEAGPLATYTSDGLKIDVSDETKFASLKDKAIDAVKGAIKATFEVSDGSKMTAYDLSLTLTGTKNDSLTVSKSDLTKAIEDAITKNKIVKPAEGAVEPNVYKLAKNALGGNTKEANYALLSDGDKFQIVEVEKDGDNWKPVDSGEVKKDIAKSDVDTFKASDAAKTEGSYQPATALSASDVKNIKVYVDTTGDSKFTNEDVHQMVPLEVKVDTTPPTDGLTIQLNGDISFNASETIKVFAHSEGKDTDITSHITLIADAENKGVFYVSASGLTKAYSDAKIADKNIPPEALLVKVDSLSLIHI